MGQSLTLRASCFNPETAKEKARQFEQLKLKLTTAIIISLLHVKS